MEGRMSSGRRRSGDGSKQPRFKKGRAFYDYDVIHEHLSPDGEMMVRRGGTWYIIEPTPEKDG